MIHTLLAQAPAVGPQSMIPQILLWVGIFGVFYFFIIRPQQKKAKEQKALLAGIKKGDEVVTVGGMHGRVFLVDELTVTLDLDKGVKLTFDKSAISRTIK